jgi:photosystem II stability/assembly factor-like uncharacterized protein
VWRLHTPSSGAFFARTRQGLDRSDDGGVSWHPVQLPPLAAKEPLDGDAVVVDPTNHDVIFSAGDEGIYRSLDAGEHWSLSLSTPLQVRAVAVSEASPSLVYAALGWRSYEFQIWRSDDRGGTWTNITPSFGPVDSCTWTVYVLAPDPVDTERVFGSWTCVRGATLVSFTPLHWSGDRGATWHDWSLIQSRPGFKPRQIVGGSAANPGRRYGLTTSNFGEKLSVVTRSDDDGASWTIIFENGTSVNDAGPPARAIAVDPEVADRVFLGLGRSADGTEGGVLCSTDAGGS